MSIKENYTILVNESTQKKSDGIFFYLNLVGENHALAEAATYFLEPSGIKVDETNSTDFDTIVGLRRGTIGLG